MKAILLDMDGVILRTAPIHFSAYRAVFARHEVDFSHDDYLRLADGRSRDTVIRAVLGDGVNLSQVMTEKGEEVDRILLGETPPIVPGFIELIDALDEAGCPYAIATSSRSPRAFLEAAGLIQRFTHIAHRGLVQRGKPAPDVFLLAAELLSTPIEDCVIIEDSPAGITAGREAGATVYALSTTVDASHLSDAHRVFEGHHALLRVLQDHL